MDPKKIQQMIDEGRELLRGAIYAKREPDYQTDQELKRPQPPLVKDPMRSEQIDLPRNFEDLNLTENLFTVILKRKSSRVYTQEDISLLQLSFLLWASQGIKEIRGKSYATMRTVPCGGARHPFETYMIIRHVEGLTPGTYHYLPMTHQLELLKPIEDENEMNAMIDETLRGQTWAEKSSVIFYWSIVPYRGEWRYGIIYHRGALTDIGHVSQNLYLACAALGLGTCGIGAFARRPCDEAFELDGMDEFTFHTETVGTISPDDAKAENAFYQFVEDEGL